MHCFHMLLQLSSNSHFNFTQNIVSWPWLIVQSLWVSEANSSTIHFIVMIRLAQDKISSSLKKSSKHFILAKFEMVSSLHLLSLQTDPLRYSVHRFVEPSLFSHVLDAEHSGRRDIITSSKGFVIIHVLLDIVESNTLLFKSTWIWVSKWGASPVKHKHSFILSSWRR